MFIFMVIFYLAYYIIIGFVSRGLNMTNEEISSSKVIFYIQCLISPLMFFSLFLWQNRKKRYDTINIIGVNKKFNYKHFLLSILLATMCIVFFASFCSVFDKALEYIGFNPNDDIDNSSLGIMLLNLLFLSALPAICEELIFRGIIYNGLTEKHSKFGAVLISATLFALMHGSLQQFLYQFIMGLFLGIIVMYTGNVIYSMILHFTNNSAIILIDYFSQSTTNFTTLEVIGSAVLAIAGIVVTYVVFKRMLDIKNREDGVNNSNVKYSLEEKEYMLIGILIAVIIWIITTISVFLS